MSRLSIPLIAAMSLAAPALAQAAQPPQAVFMDNCSACHQETGKGVPGAFPALAGDAFVKGPAEPVVLTVLNGRGGMPAFKDDLSDADLAAALTYIRGAWGNKAKPVTAAEVAAVRAKANAAKKAKGLQIH